MADKTYILDSCVGLTALKMFVQNANMPVGMVTVRHQVFSELIVQIRMDNDNLTDAINVFGLCFNNRHTIREGKGVKVYVSPLAGTDQNDNPYHYTTDEGIECMKISPRLADMVYQAVQVMELNPANIIAACQDLISCGRMYQELTIDAAKTMYNVEIPYGEDMIHAHMLVNDNSEEDFNARVDWQYLFGSDQDRRNMRRNRAEQFMGQSISSAKKRKTFGKGISYVANYDKSQIVHKKIGSKMIRVANIHDFLHTVRLSLLTQGLEEVDKLIDIQQEWSPELMTEMNRLASSPRVRNMRDILKFAHNIYRTIMSYQSVTIRRINESYSDKVSRDEHIKEVKADVRQAMTSLSNQIRVQAKKEMLSERQVILLMINQVFAEGKNSSFAHSLLEEEFFKFVFSLHNDDNCPQYTENRLEHCDFEEGETVTFDLGIAQDGDKEAMATSNLEGKFLIRKNEQGKLVASQKIIDLIQVHEPEPDKLMFITKPGGGKDRGFTSKNLPKITQQMCAPGAKVTLVPYLKNNKDVHDAIVVNGELIGMFRCSYSENNKAITSLAINNMYMYKEGIVDHILVSHQENQGDIAIVTLREVKTVKPPTIQKDWIAEDLQNRKQQHITMDIDSVDASLAMLGFGIPQPQVTEDKTWERVQSVLSAFL